LTNEPNTSQNRLNVTYIGQKHIKKCILWHIMQKEGGIVETNLRP